ncbi:hypothetical protein [Mycobacterium montefiorense]|uniref:hypothetical protein n=1 Tax=Mycobacterium montefiorense TaxID=154654 RepID=UPI0021F295EF|nr:hypothetical protein [Mycobacterium montefiorense]MCV7427874.1 hypothetical protein [Mycobacterium montefiorense]
MNDLLETTIGAHGGLDRWREARTVTTSLRSWGQTWSIKSHPNVFSLWSTFAAATTSQSMQVDPFNGAGRRGIYTPERVHIESADGTILQERAHPREAFKGHTLVSAWDHLHCLYFASYAMWTYLNLPFVAARPDVDAQEIDPWVEESGEKWRRLRLTFPPQIATHTSVQDLYIDSNGLIARHDYSVDVIPAPLAAHYLFDYADYDGIQFPSLRKVVPLDADNRPGPLSDPEALLIGIELRDYSVT